MSQARVSDMSPSQFRLGAIIVLALASLLRLWDLGGPSLWFDEAVYIINSQGSFSDIVANTQNNNSSPLFLPLLLGAINGTVGLGEFSARFPSAIFGIASVGVMLALVWTGLPRWVALVSAALLAVGQIQIIYSQEVREYGASILVAACLLWTGIYAAKQGKWVYFAIAAAIAPWIAYGPCFAVLAVLVWLAFYTVLGRFELKLWNVGAAGAAFIGSAILAYLFVAKYQLGTAQQYYLVEHYLGPSGMNPVMWFATNTGGVFLASLPGLLGVILGGLVALAFVVRNIRKPIDLLSEPAIVLAVILLGGLAMAGILALYPFGSPRHSAFVGPFLVLAVAIALRNLAQIFDPAKQKLALAGISGAFGLAAVLGIVGVTPGASLHPAIEKVGEVRVYGEYENNRAMMEFARDNQKYALYGMPGVSPGYQLYGMDLPISIAPRDLIGEPAAQAQHIIDFMQGRETLVMVANAIPGEADDVRAELYSRGMQVDSAFADTRVEAFVVSHVD